MILYLGGRVINYSENKPRKQWNKETPQTLMNILSNADVSLAFKTYTIYKPGKSPVCEQTFLWTGLLIKTFVLVFFYMYRACALEFMLPQAVLIFLKFARWNVGLQKSKLRIHKRLYYICLASWRAFFTCSSVAEWGCDRNAATTEPCGLHPAKRPGVTR